MPSSERFPLLFQIDSPADLRRMDENQLPALCKELRQYLIESVAQTGGHLGSSLGTVELTVALHAAYHTPNDRIVWDVGHQAYPHKILTGRRDRMHTMRKKEGLAGFPNRNESEFDTFGVGHSSTSISAALGMATAAKLNGEQRRAVAVIGDGAITAGLAYEALNNAGHWKSDLLVVLNDNDMSISPNVGALNQSLTRVLSGRPFTDARAGGKRVLQSLPGPLAEIARRAEEHVKGMVAPGTLFEELGFTYYGPVDGHDIQTLLPVLRNLRDMRGPILLHVITKKGKGYRRAEEDALALHAVTPFDPNTGKPLKAGSNTLTYTQVFSDWLCDMAEQDGKLVGITPAMREGSGLVDFHQRFPERYFDVAIAEQQSVTLAAGMACDGLKPVVAIYSSFLQRGYDQLIHDVALQNLDVTFAIDRAGVVGPDGPTHAGAYDLSFLRCIPNMVVMAPANENECRQMLTTAHRHPGPAAVRYPRGGGPGVTVESDLQDLPIGKAQTLRKGKHIALLAFGSLVDDALSIGEELDLSVINMRFVKPLDQTLINCVANEHAALVTLEENAVMGGAGSAVCEHLNAAGILKPVLQIGLPDCYLEHGSREELLLAAQLDRNNLRRRVLDFKSRTANEDSATGDRAPA
ncbi:MAG: 1-deoxy-D-xylulose-5-phosphate synthase [Granulosicoccaceae bacterium]